MVQKIAGYWRFMIDRRVVSTHATKADAMAALRKYNRSRKVAS